MFVYAEEESEIVGCLIYFRDYEHPYEKEKHSMKFMFHDPNLTGSNWFDTNPDPCRMKSFTILGSTVRPGYIMKSASGRTTATRLVDVALHELMRDNISNVRMEIPDTKFTKWMSEHLPWHYGAKGKRGFAIIARRNQFWLCCCIMTLNVTNAMVHRIVQTALKDYHQQKVIENRHRRNVRGYGAMGRSHQRKADQFESQSQTVCGFLKNLVSATHKDHKAEVERYRKLKDLAMQEVTKTRRLADNIKQSCLKAVSALTSKTEHILAQFDEVNKRFQNLWQ